ncbi:bifunctional methylenetetrahydrofolate dehydrogenase/methenyltetrahydrofolate cyclohydrolase FolD [archaeon]|jgi:methylenetetrahydrofolate dehydrogenase (NADP+) / methenyltetrahydrofolate cyclohydrolase|nr:bifunctional methylenetetrahydrofolate dehydrogenase/methenyltetrahydrofolate cyclohydrolase FolD [archaeon]MBT4022218.1 bifunctional methylenetetrahydrofolate dehydrogenase/methenyltetrahydrofolate cyclohydrolase FolD [archaeon]MBT4272831.1 bifunctional methylenetetrahydrofolate dehydrogenase/methenyltetrahydrofolate cyclohydrolase FolD [archaeon]MBT4461631.1 bifunctional methylenetetrahydrofolate dehydrogenase/methenyltetrahydrofolate cyclohydrolase FolD [archaeon]MBT4857601.1 bifunctional
MDIDGRKLSKKIKDQIKIKVEKLEKKPGLAVVLVGENSASQVYVRNKERACQKVGYYSRKINLPVETTQEELLNLIEELNNDELIHGILVQLPLPNHIDSEKIILTIDPKKDVDGFHALNMGNLLIGKKTIIPCTPKGIIELIKSTGIEISGKNAVVIGRSNIVGKPISLLLMKNNATITICHSKTLDLKKHCLNADIIVAAIGKPNFVTEDMVKKGCVVIDVGINRLDDGSLSGDVDYINVKNNSSYITPVPGGVGPMTIAMLMQNTLECYKEIEKLE